MKREHKLSGFLTSICAYEYKFDKKKGVLIL